VLKNNNLLLALNKDFGSLENFKKKFNEKTVAVQGSGWGWLFLNKNTGKLEITTTQNQDILTNHVFNHLIRFLC
jgi:Fe-Mn family superoxide dismutase